MLDKDKIFLIQEQLLNEGLQGWLLYTFQKSNGIARNFLGVDSAAVVTRRLFYWIPQKGSPIKIVHRMESAALAHLPGEELSYASWQELDTALATVLVAKGKVAMEYSPLGALPYLSKVDAGTVEKIESCGAQVVTSAPLLARFAAQLSEAQVASHKAAAEALDRIVSLAWQHITHHIDQGKTIDEYAVQQFIVEKMHSLGFTTSHPPIVAVNANSADPHYSPQQHSSCPIRRGDFILIDLWCRQNVPHAVYADICRVAIADTAPSPRQQAVFLAVKAAQDACIALVQERLQDRKSLMGWEVDALSHKVLTEHGFSANRMHRVGHSIDTHPHGMGTHLDDFETHDTRKILPATCFSVEPGVYLQGDFGIRLECDVLVHSDGHIEITGGQQEKILALLAAKGSPS